MPSRSPLRKGSKRSFCSRKPTRPIVPVASTPSMSTRPPVGSSNPAMMLKIVVLPQPEGPMRLTKRPCGMASVTGASARKAPLRVWNVMLTSATQSFGADDMRTPRDRVADLSTANYIAKTVPTIPSRLRRGARRRAAPGTRSLNLAPVRLHRHDTREANGASLRRHLLRGRHAARLHHDLDCVLDAILGVANCGGQVVEREGMRVDLGGVEPLLAHECFGTMGRALAFAANAIDVDVVAHDLRDVDRRLLVREGGEADFAAAVDHAD